MPIPAASGYPQYSNSLITPMFRMDLLERFYETTIYSDISSTEYEGEFSKGGDQITFMREPKVIVRDYDKNGKIIHDTIDGEPVTMTIDYAKTFSIKMNMIDEKQIQNFDRWKESFLNSAGRELARQIDPHLIAEIWGSAAAFSRGSTAGLQSQSADLGAPGAPRVVTQENINIFLSEVHQVLDEALAPQDNRWIVLPPIAHTLMMASELRLAYATGMSQSPLLNGRLPNEIGGFTIIKAINLGSVMDGTDRVYRVIAGVKMATAFAAQIERSREVTDKDDWANYYQGLSVYGFKVLYPDAVVAAYIKFEMATAA